MVKLTSQAHVIGYFVSNLAN